MAQEAAASAVTQRPRLEARIASDHMAAGGVDCQRGHGVIWAVDLFVGQRLQAAPVAHIPDLDHLVLQEDSQK